MSDKPLAKKTKAIRGPGGALRRSRAVEEAVSRVSRLLLSGEEVDLTGVMAILGEAVAVDRAYLFQFREGGSRMDNTHEWCAPGIQPQIEKLQDLNTTDPAWTMGTLSRNREVIVTAVQRMPPEASFEHDFVASQDIRAYLLVPVFFSGALVGFMGFDDTHKSRHWTREDIRLLRTVTDLINAYLEHRKVLKALQEERAQLLSIFDSLNQSIFVTDMDTYKILFANTVARQRHGRDLIGKLCHQVLHRRDDPCPFCTNAILRLNPAQVYRWEHHSTTTGRDYLIFDRLIRWPDGRDVHFELDIDITEMNQMRQSLAREKEWLSVTLHSIREGVIATDAAGQIALMNPTAVSLTGWPEEEALGRPLQSVFSITEESGGPLADPAALVTKRRMAVSQQEGLLIDRDGNSRLITDSAAPILDENGAVLGVVLVFQDVSERRRLERELQREEKLKSLGVMAGGIAHDFNNILTSVIGHLSLASLEAPPGSELAASLAASERATLRARRLTSQLLTFAKGGVPMRKEVASPGELLRDAARFSIRSPEVACRFHIAPKLWPVRVDETQISQVVQNLTLNAAQAMPNGGTVEIFADNVELEKGQRAGLAAGRYLKVQIVDRGVGIPPALQSRIFDPFFTTKEKGSGLGLTTTYSIIKQHEGTLELESVPGQGTRVTFFLPALDYPIPEPAAEDATIPTGQGRILLVDDEEMVRAAAGKIMTRLGYEPVLAADSQEAIRLFQAARQAARPFEAVILDLAGPNDRQGLATLEALRTIDPGIKSLISSKSADDKTEAEYHLLGLTNLLPKPYSLRELSRALHDLLTSS